MWVNNFFVESLTPNRNNGCKIPNFSEFDKVLEFATRVERMLSLTRMINSYYCL